MSNKTTAQSATKIGEQQTGSYYFQLFLYRAPKKNNEAIAKNLKQFMLWCKEHGARVEYYQFGKSQTQTVMHSARENGIDVLDNIAQIPFTIEDEEEFWMEVQYFRDYRHCKDVYTKMMQDRNIESLGNEFFGLVTQGKKLITRGFNHLRG